MFSHPFKTVRRAGSPSAGGNALSMETHIASTSAHPQYQKKGDAASNVDLSAHIDARGMEDHAAYYLRVSELETSIDNYKSTTINVSDILNAAARPGNPKKCVVSTLLLREVIEDHKTTSDNTYVPNVRVITSVTGPADAASLTYWSSGTLPGVIGEEAFSALRAIVLTNEQDIRNLSSTNSASLASDNPLKGKAADFDHTHTLEEIDTYGQVADIDSKVNSILATYVTRDMLKDNEGWELELSKVGIYPEANDGTKEVEETVTVDGVETTVTRIEVVDLNQRTRQGHSIYKVATEDGLVGIPTEIANLKSETANLATTKSNLIVDVQVTENTMHEHDTDIVSHPGATTRAITQRLVTSTDGVVSTGYVGENVHDNRAQTFFRTGHAYGYSGYIGSIASLMGVSPRELTEMTNEEIVDAFYDLHPDGYDFSYFRATHGEKLRWNGTKDANIYAPVHVTAFAAGTTYYEYDIGESKHVVTSDTTPDAAKMYYIIVGNKGYSIALGETPSDAGEAAVYNRLFSVTDNTSLTVDASSYLCGRFSAYTAVEGEVDPETDKRILGADLVTEAYGTGVLLEKMFRTDTTEITEAVGIPVSNDAVNGSGEYVVAEMDAIFRKGLFYTTEDTTVVKGKRYFSRGMDDGYNEILGLAEGDVIDTTSPYYEVITLEDVFNARSAAEELTTTGSINVKTLVDAGAARIVYDFDEQSRLIVWGPWDQLATKHYVDKKLENVSVEGGSGFGGGVIDGTVLLEFNLSSKTDWTKVGSDYGIELITRDLPVSRNGAETSELVTVSCARYTVKNDCLLNVRMQDISFPGYGAGRITVDLINDKGEYRCFGEFFEFLSGPDERKTVSVPVKVGTKFVISCQGIKYSLVEGEDKNSIADVAVCMPLDISKIEAGNIAIQEYRLNSLNVTVGLPNYDKGEDIKSKVVRTVLNTPKGYKAPSDGFVLFDFIVPLYQAPYQVNYYTNAKAYINGIRVFCARTDYKNGSYNQDAGLIPVRKGDLIDWDITSDTGTSPWIQDVSSWPEVKCTFFPLVGTGESTSGPIEYAIAECPFALTGTTNPFLSGSTIPTGDKRLISASNVKSRTGRDVNIGESTIKLVMDVFFPKHNADGSVYIDSNGFVVPDDSKPMFRDDVSGYHINTGATNNFEYPPFVVSNVGGNAVVMWSITTGGNANYVVLPSLVNISGASGGFPVVSHASGNAGSIEVKSYTSLMAKAASLGLSNYYIRLTAVIDPNRKNVIESKSGMFVTGDIAKDENGKVCKTLVPYTEWAAKQDSDGKYVYEYTVKTDCWLHADYLVHAHNTASDEVVVTINGEVLGAYAENSQSTLDVSTYGNTISMPVKRGAKIGFHSVSKPTHNWESHVAEGSSEILKEPYAIKLIEFKMGTELNPAQFPSLAVRVLDCDMGEVDSNLGKTYTWTESELRQIFGPMYSVDESRIEFSTTFYKATSAEGFDSASVKMTATTDCKLDGIAYSKFPTTISKNDVGENIISVYVPDKSHMLTPVSWDATNAKFIMNDTAIQLDDSDMLSGVRMRLSMHISDRRGDMPDELLPNGISPNSKMVRQGDMNIAAANALGNVAYTNEITITESGICIIMSNFDSDVTGVDYTIVAVQALIGGEWTTIQTAPTQTINDGRGVQSFNFPVEAGTKLRIATDAGITGAAGNIQGTRSELDAMFTHAHQALCWVIPTGKYQNPELNRPGSAGVIDGSIWKRKDGTDEVTEFSAPTATSAYYTPFSYNVKNDCLLFIQRKNSGTHTATAVENCPVFVNGVQVATISDVSTDIVEEYTVTLPVAEGSVVTVGDGSAIVWSSGMKYKFTEFKLRATNVLAAMPDWDESKAVNLGNGSVVEADGWIVFRVDDSTIMDNSYQARSYINGVEVYYWGWERSDGDNNTNTVNVPVCKGDVLTHNDVSGRMSCTFYPVKMTRTEYPDKVIVPNWSGDGVSLNSGDTVPGDGFVVINGDGIPYLMINGIEVSRGGRTTNYIEHTDIIPVAKNDVVSYGDSSGRSIRSVKFYPAKPATTAVSEADVLEEKINKNAADIAANASAIEDNATEIETLKNTLSSMDNTAAILSAVYPVGSVYIDGNNADTCPMASVIPGSTWTKIGSKLLTDASTAPVVGDGSPLGVTIDTEPNGARGIITSINNQNYSLGMCSVQLPEHSGNYRGSSPVYVTQDNTRSGMVAKLSEATGLTVTLWKRTA